MKKENNANTVGRPPIYKTAKAMQTQIDKYFNSLGGQDKNGKPLCIDDNPTITGLVYTLGFSDRASFYDYEKRPEFSHTVKRARLRIENWYEKTMLTSQPTGPIFALKNLGWKDKTELESDNTHTLHITRSTLKGREDGN